MVLRVDFFGTVMEEDKGAQGCTYLGCQLILLAPGIGAFWTYTFEQEQ